MKDLRRVAKDLGELTDDNTLQEMIERADFDTDGLVSEEELYNLLTKKAYWFAHAIIILSILKYVDWSFDQLKISKCMFFI